MKVLLDTCVLSELRRSDGNPRVRATVESHRDSDLFISVLTLGEIIKGITLLTPGKKKKGCNNGYRESSKTTLIGFCQLTARRAASGARSLLRRARTNHHARS